MRRREFITLFGSGAAAWPLVAHAQQREKMRRIGVLMNLAADDAEGQARLAAFLQGLQEAGWGVGRSAADNLCYTARLNAFTSTEREDRIKSSLDSINPTFDAPTS
jgi:putative ABC transport system substrate-binding protein